MQEHNLRSMIMSEPDLMRVRDDLAAITALAVAALELQCLPLISMAWTRRSMDLFDSGC